MTDEINLHKVVECINGRLEKVEDGHVAQTANYSTIRAEMSELKVIRTTVMDLHGDLAVVKEGNTKLEKEVKALRDSRHDHSNHIQKHQGKIQVMEANIESIRADQKVMKEDLVTMKEHQIIGMQEIRLNTKLIGWGGALVTTILVVGLSIIIWLLQPLLKSLGLH